MDKQSSIRLLDETFGKNYNCERFCRFVKEVFNKIEINIRTWNVWPQYEDYIERYSSLGTYKDNNDQSIEILEVQLRKTSSRDRARTMQRNFIATFLKRYMKDAALVAFYGDDPSDWRFSFVKMEYNLIRDEGGKVTVDKILTPAKRYSYLVGEKEPNHTCKSQFLELIEKVDTNPLISDIENAFSIDNVTKEFFEKYKDLVIDLKESIVKVMNVDKNVVNEFESKFIKPIDFAKKLLGQIVFLYFLQKKGWLGVEKGKEWGTGPHNFLRKLFGNKSKNIDPMISYKNFFNEILEPLFYDALSNDRPGDDGYYFLFDCKIPFLNGGLFEPLNDYDWKGADILINNNIFEKIFEVFDRFNFTVKEDEPLDKEVAVDPEMLGKVFENLLEVKERKDKGAFYTPREIVHYMCQESLINYLEANTDIRRNDIENFILYGDLTLEHIIKDLEQKKLDNENRYDNEENLIPESISYNFRTIDRLLKNIKIIDPAVGSGAFPVGMMNEIIKARSILTIYFPIEEQKIRTNYSLKRETIENSLYGVDIDQSGVEIAKLRFWLSLIVDETDMSRIKPLPNLDHKVMCGNSLLEEFEGIELFDEKLLGTVKKDKREELKEIDEQILDLKDNLSHVKSIEIEKRTYIANEINKLKRKREKIAKKVVTENTEQISLGITESEKKIKTLKILQKKYFNEQNGKIKRELRSNIDNIEWELIEVTLREQNHEYAMEKLKKYERTKVKPFFLWKLYFAEVFQRETPGFDVVIANPPYVGEKGHKKIFREIKISEFGIKFYKRKMDFFYFFFHKSIDLARQNAIISFITTNYYITADGALLLRKDFKLRTTVYRLINFNELRIFDSARGQHNMITILKKGKDNEYNLKACTTYRKGNASSTILQSILSWSDEFTNYYYKPQNQIYDGENCYIRLLSEFDDTKVSIEGILNKIKEGSPQLINFKKVNQGVLTGADKVAPKHIKDNLTNSQKGEGIFVLDNKELQHLNLIDKEKKIIKNYYKNSDIFKYFTKSLENKRNLIYLTRDKNIDDFPTIKNHILKHEKIIKNRSKERGEMQAALKLGKWWVIFAARGEVDFDGPKIVCPQRAPSNIFVIDKSIS